MSAPARRLTLASDGPAEGGGDLRGLEAISAAVTAGAGLPEVVRAASRALDASLALIDRSGAVLAVAAGSPTDERALVAGGSEIATEELLVAEEVVGRLRMRARKHEPSPAVLSLVRTLIAAELQRVQAPGRASEQAASGFVRALVARELTEPAEIVAAGAEVGIALEGGGSVLVVRAHPLAPTDDDWRARVLAIAERGARAAAPMAIAARSEASDGPHGEVFLLLPGPDEATSRRAGEVVLRELENALHGFSFAVGRSRVTADPAELHRAGHEALLAANVADGDQDATVLAFEETGAYRLLLPAMSEDPHELQRFYAETLEPLVAYDEQYETDLVQTLETYFDSDGNVAGTAQKLFTHRHTVRYRLERVRELSGLDVGSTDGREKLSLGLKAMRVLGIPAPRGPATEVGAEGGRVPGGPRDNQR